MSVLLNRYAELQIQDLIGVLRTESTRIQEAGDQLRSVILSETSYGIYEEALTEWVRKQQKSQQELEEAAEEAVLSLTRLQEAIDFLLAQAKMSGPADGKRRLGEKTSSVPENLPLLSDRWLKEVEKEEERRRIEEQAAVSDGFRSPQKPREWDPNGNHRGSWKGNSFSLNPDFLYTHPDFCPDGKTVSEIRTELKESYGIDFNGRVPFLYGRADFSGVSVLSVDTGELMKRFESSLTAKSAFEKLERLDQESLLFTEERREENMEMADQIASDRNLPLPMLGDHYTKEALTAWRQEHHFTWHEQLDGHYYLVPSVLHDLVRHTGLVSTVKNAAEGQQIYRDFGWLLADDER